MTIFPMQLLQMMRGGGNPRQMAINMLRQNAGSNPVKQNALQMIENGDINGIEKLCRNLGKESGVDVDAMMSQLKNQYGMK